MPHDHARPEHHHHAASFDGLDDETAAFARHWDEVLDWLVDRAPDSASVLDLGTGNGVAAIGLARRLPAAQVVAVDAQDTWFAAVADRVTEAGVGTRVRTVVADIDAAVPEPSVPADLVIASNCLHHVADAGAVLRRIREVAADGALLCVVEAARPVRVLADDDPAAGAETRAAEALGARLREAMPLLTARWTGVVEQNGWRVEAEREFATTADPAADPAALRFAVRHLSRVAAGSTDRLTADDATALHDALDRALTDPRAVSWGVDGSRIAVLARPAHSADTR